MTLRVFVDEVRAGELDVDGDEHHYATRVRRARVGDAIEIVDATGRRAAGTIVAIAGAAMRVHAREVERVASPRPRVCVLLPWIKGDRMEQCIEKLAEVGCDEVRLWRAERAVVRVAADKLDDRVRRLRDVARAAARQCGRAVAMDVAGEVELGAVDVVPDVVLDVNAAAMAMAELAALGDRDTVSIISGPEGGFAPDELHRLAAVKSLGLGPRVLRAETAPVIAVALIRAASAT